MPSAALRVDASHLLICMTLHVCPERGKCTTRLAHFKVGDTQNCHLKNLMLKYTNACTLAQSNTHRCRADRAFLGLVSPTRWLILANVSKFSCTKGQFADFMTILSSCHCQCKFQQVIRKAKQEVALFASASSLWCPGCGPIPIALSQAAK